MLVFIFLYIFIYYIGTLYPFEYFEYSVFAFCSNGYTYFSVSLIYLTILSFVNPIDIAETLLQRSISFSIVTMQFSEISL